MLSEAEGRAKQVEEVRGAPAPRTPPDRARRHVLSTPALVAALPGLRGRELGCWCKPQACHGDVLLELLADRPTEQNADGD